MTLALPPYLQTIGLRTLSNVFMTFAWYAHIKDMRAKPWLVAALVSWGIALFEYLLQVPANRIGFSRCLHRCGESRSPQGHCQRR